MLFQVINNIFYGKKYFVFLFRNIPIYYSFFSDILLNFRTTFVNNKGEVITSSKSIALNYAKGWFFLDLIAALPFEIFIFYIEGVMVSVSEIFKYLSHM